MSSEAKNLEAISKAIKKHDATCRFGGKAIEVLMNPFEVERLDWDEIMGVPISGDPQISTGRFVIVCDKEGNPLEKEEIVEAVSPEREVVAV